jgi:hypothetical protein
MEAHEANAEAWALDVSQMECAEVIESLKSASLKAETNGKTSENTGNDLNGRDAESVEMDVMGDLESGGMGISDAELNRGAGEVFSGLTKILSGMVGQDLTPTEEEKKEAGRKFGPVIQKRFPTVRRYTPETAVLLWLLGYLNDKTDVSELVR